jgi:hypothetical protein
MNPTPNAGRIAITLRPRGERVSSADEIVVRLKQAVAPLPGITVWFQPVQDIQIGTRPSRAPDWLLNVCEVAVIGASLFGFFGVGSELRVTCRVPAASYTGLPDAGGS